MPALVAYASRHTPAQGIAKRTAAILRASGLEADLAAAEDAGDPAGYDAFVIASTVYASRSMGPASELIRNNGALLTGRPAWLFSGGPVGRRVPFPATLPRSWPLSATATWPDPATARGQKCRPCRVKASLGGIVNEILLYLGGALTIGWGTAHLYPTLKIVRGFGGISRDNQLVLTMEWLAEAFLLIFTGLLVVLMAARFGADNAAAQTVFAVSAGMLLVWAAVSAATGGRVHFVMYRLCAPIFTVSAALILIGAFE